MVDGTVNVSDVVEGYLSVCWNPNVVVGDDSDDNGMCQTPS